MPWQAAGVVLIVLGRIVTLYSVLTIRSGNRQREESFLLHTTGLFRWSRNPGLVGMYLFIVGLWLAMPSLAMAGGIVVYVVYMDFKVHMEEDFLLNQFGQEYANYRNRTGRYLP